MSVLFYGDPHREWDPLFLAARAIAPTDIVVMGDLELDEPFRIKVAPLLALGIACHWIAGNHDTRSVEMFSYLWDDCPDGNLSGRVAELGAGRLRVAGLGGHYKGKIWFPRMGDEPPTYPSRSEFLRCHGRAGTFREGIPLGQRATIFPEDHVKLGSQRCDILVCHEAPTSMSGGMGFGAIDDLARDMGASLVLHGHHHTIYDGHTRDGIAVRGLGKAEVFVVE